MISLCMKAIQKRIQKGHLSLQGNEQICSAACTTRLTAPDTLVVINDSLKATFSRRLILVQGNESQIFVFFISTRPRVAKGVLTLYILVFKRSISYICFMKAWPSNWVNRLSLSFFFFFLVKEPLLVPAGWKHLTRSLKFDFHALCKTSGDARFLCECSRSPPSVVSPFISKWAYCITARGGHCNLSGTTCERCRTRNWG